MLGQKVQGSVYVEPKERQRATRRQLLSEIRWIKLPGAKGMPDGRGN